MKTSIKDLLRFYKQVKVGLQQDKYNKLHFYQHNNERIYCNMDVFEFEVKPNEFFCCMLGLWAKVNNVKLPIICSASTVAELTGLHQNLVNDLFFNYPKGQYNDFVFHIDRVINKLTEVKNKESKESKMSKQLTIQTKYRIYINDTQHIAIDGQDQWLRRSDARLVINNWLRKLYNERIKLDDVKTLFIEVSKNSLKLYEVNGILYFVLRRGQMCYSMPCDSQWSFVLRMENVFVIKP